MLSGQSLSEAVNTLQCQDLAPEARAMMDDAARLLGEGREEEARALVEKVEALAAPGDVGAGAGTEDRAVNAGGGRQRALQALITPLAEKLAAGFTGVLTSVLEDLHNYTGDQIQAVANSLLERIESMESALRDAGETRERLDRCANQQAADLQSMQHRQDEFGAALQALTETGQLHNESLTRVTAATDELSNHLVSHADVVASRFAVVEERLTTLDRFAQETPPHIEGIVARLDTNTETLRSLEQRQTHRMSTLNQVLDSLARLREPEAEVGLTACA